MKAHQKGDVPYMPSPTLTVTPKVALKEEKGSKKMSSKKRSLKLAKPKILTISFQIKQQPLTYNDNPYKCCDCFKSFLTSENRIKHIHLIHGTPLDSIESKLTEYQSYDEVQENIPPVAKTTSHSANSKSSLKSALSNTSKNSIHLTKKEKKKLETAEISLKSSKSADNITANDVSDLNTTGTTSNSGLSKKSKKSTSEKSNKLKYAKNNSKMMQDTTNNKMSANSNKIKSKSGLLVTATLSAPKKPIPKLPRTVANSEETVQLSFTPQKTAIYPHSYEYSTPKTPKNDTSSSSNTTSGSENSKHVKQAHNYYHSSSVSSGHNTAKHYTELTFNRSKTRQEDPHSSNFDFQRKHSSSSSSHQTKPRKHSSSHESGDHYSSHIRSDRHSTSGSSYDRLSQVSPYKHSTNRSYSEYRSRENSDEKRPRYHSYSYHGYHHHSSREGSHHSSQSKQVVDNINKSPTKRSSSLYDDISNEEKKIKLTSDS